MAEDRGCKDDDSAGGGPVAASPASPLSPASPASPAPYFMSLAGQLGVGGMLGYSAGYAAKEIGRRVMYYAGVGVLALQVLQYNGIVKVHWGTLFNVIEGGLDTDGDGKISRQEYIDFNKNNSMSMSAANNLKMELQNKGFPKTAAAAEEAAATDVAPAAENPAPAAEPAAEAAAEAAPAPAAE